MRECPSARVREWAECASGRVPECAINDITELPGAMSRYRMPSARPDRSSAELPDRFLIMSLAVEVGGK